MFSRGVDKLRAVFDQSLEKIEQNNAKTVDFLMETNKVLIAALNSAHEKLLALSGDAFLRLKTPEITKNQNTNEYSGPIDEIMKIEAFTKEEELQKQAAIEELNSAILGARGVL